MPQPSGSSVTKPTVVTGWIKGHTPHDPQVVTTGRLPRSPVRRRDEGAAPPGSSRGCAGSSDGGCRREREPRPWHRSRGPTEPCRPGIERRACRAYGRPPRGRRGSTYGPHPCSRREPPRSDQGKRRCEPFGGMNDDGVPQALPEPEDPRLQVRLVLLRRVILGVFLEVAVAAGGSDPRRDFAAPDRLQFRDLRLECRQARLADRLAVVSRDAHLVILARQGPLRRRQVGRSAGGFGDRVLCSVRTPGR